MILGIGTDITDIARIERLLAEQGQRFLGKCFTEQEVNYAQSSDHKAASLAKRWAGKEAVVKALGRGFGDGLYWKDVEILGGGKPEIVIHQPHLIADYDQLTFHLSLSDDGGMALAFAIIEKKR